MQTRTVLILATVTALGINAAAATAHHGRKHRPPPTLVEAPPHAGTLVLHPASNIACNTQYRATRALPCDQPVWVYGSPCEIDLGLGFYRSCN